MKYYFMFGYETPGMAAANKRLRTDMADNMAFFILAESKDAALAWGQRLADAYVQAIYRDPTVTLEKLGFAPGSIMDGGPKEFWAVTDLAKHWTEQNDATVAEIPVVRVGEMPDLAAIVSQRYGGDHHTTDA